MFFVVALKMRGETKHKAQSAKLTNLNSFDNHRDALPAPYTRRGQSVSSAASMQLVQYGKNQTRPGRSQGMTQRNRAAVDIRA